VRTGFLRNDGDPKKRKGLVLLSVLLVSLFLLTASTGFALFARRSVRAFDGRQRAFTARMVCEAPSRPRRPCLNSTPEKAMPRGTKSFLPGSSDFPKRA
jgi:hypothetical protein